VAVAAQAVEATAQVAAVAARVAAAEEDKKIRPKSNKKTTFAASMQGSLFIFKP